MEWGRIRWPSGRVPWIIDYPSSDRLNSPLYESTRNRAYRGLRKLIEESTKFIQEVAPGVSFEESRGEQGSLKFFVYLDDECCNGVSTLGYVSPPYDFWRPQEKHIGLSSGCFPKYCVSFLNEKDKSRVILHEIMHSLGVMHEHQRPDRNRFIRF